jgi:hypothetical protein
MKKTIFIAAMLAAATVLAAGLTVLPSSVQEAQANPCANEITVEDGGSIDNGLNNNPQDDDERECKFIGPVELDED